MADPKESKLVCSLGDSPADHRILVAGASARAAAESLRRAGFVPWAADLFADVDQIAGCPTIRLAGDPQDLLAAWRRLPPSPWIVAGGLENRPRLLGQLAEIHPLLGTAPATVRQVRNPWELNRVLTAAGFPLPEILRTWEATADPAAWLWKPLRSAGGTGIGHADRPGKSHGYFQRFVPGDVLGATYLGTPPGVRLLGVSQQLSGPAWGEAPGFAYGGSIGPMCQAPQRIEQLEALGRALCGNFALVGLFGVDLVDDGRQFWPLEVNPRYTASVEVLELALGRSLMAEHLAACLPRVGPFCASGLAAPPPATPLLGKAIVYALRPWTVSAARFQRLCDLHERQPLHLAADLPTPGSIIPPGAPIATVFAWGDTVESVRAALRERIAACRAE